MPLISVRSSGTSRATLFPAAPLRAWAQAAHAARPTWSAALRLRLRRAGCEGAARAPGPADRRAGAAALSRGAPAPGGVSFFRGTHQRSMSSQRRRIRPTSAFLVLRNAAFYRDGDLTATRYDGYGVRRRDTTVWGQVTVLQGRPENARGRSRAQSRYVVARIRSSKDDHGLSALPLRPAAAPGRPRSTCRR